MRARIITTGILLALTFPVAATASAGPTSHPGQRVVEAKRMLPKVWARGKRPTTYGTIAPSPPNKLLPEKIDVCSEMRDLQTYSRNLTTRIYETIVEIESYDDVLESLRIRRGSYDEHAESVKASSTAVGEAEVLARSIEDLGERIDDLRTKRAQCAHRDGACHEDISDEIELLKKEKTMRSAELAAKRHAVGQAMREYDRLKGQAEAVQHQIDDIFALIDRKIQFLIQARAQIQDMYKTFANLKECSPDHQYAVEVEL